MPGTFIVQLDNLNDQISKLEKIFSYYDKKIKEEGLNLVSHDLTEEIKSLKSFKTDLQALLQESLLRRKFGGSWEIDDDAAYVFGKPLSEEDREWSKKAVDYLFGKTDEEPIFHVDDLYGNFFQDVKNYKYLEISYGSYNKFNTLRFLGVKDFQKIRFYVSDLEHDFNPTTISLLQNIRGIIEEPNSVDIQELLDCKREPWSRDKETGEKLWRDMTNPKEEEMKVKYTWSEATRQFLVPEGITAPVGEMTDEQQSKIFNKLNRNISLTKEELIRKNKEIQSHKKSLLEKAKIDKDRAVDPIESVEELLDRAGKSLAESAETATKTATELVVRALDKYSIGCLISEAINCLIPPNLNCVDLFRNLPPSEVFGRLAMVFPRGSSAFKQMEKVVEENVFSGVGELEREIASLELSLSELEAVKEQLEERPVRSRDTEHKINTANKNIESYEKEISEKKKQLDEKRLPLFKDLKFSERQQRVAREKGNLQAIFLTPETEEERIGGIAITDKILNAIDTIIPLEDLCEAITNAMSLAGGSFPFAEFEGFEKPSLPEPRPVNDIFSNVSVEINQAFVQGLVQALIFFVKGVVDQLLNCDNLDALIARALGASSESTNTIYDALFGGDKELQQAMIGPMVDNFVDTSLPYLQNMIDIKAGGEEKQVDVSLGINVDTQNLLSSSVASNVSSNAAGVFDFFASQGTQDPTANWDISFDGEKFETSNGIRIIDLEEADKFLNSVSEDITKALTEEGIENITAGVLKDLLKLRDGDDAAPGLAESSASDALTEDRESLTKDELKEEFGALFNSCTALLSPTETINLLAGKPSPNSLKVVSGIMKLRSPRLANAIKSPAQIKNMFGNFGNATGLGELRDQLDLIAANPISRNRNISSNACGPYNSVDDFRKDLMTKELEEDVVNKIIDNINKEKEATIRSLANSILDSLNGKGSKKPVSNFKKESANAILDALNGKDVQPYEEKPKKEEKSLTEKFEEEARNALNNSDTYKDILNSTTSAFFDPIRDVIDRDLGNYIETISRTREVDVILERYITKKDKDGNDKKIITSEFREKLNEGFVPIKDEDNPKRAILVPGKQDGGVPDDTVNDGNKDQLYLNGELPLYKKENKKIVADSFIQNFKNIKNNLNISSGTDILSISLAGSFADANVFEQFGNLDVQIFNSESNMLNGMRDSTVKWNINYFEASGAPTSLSINSTGVIYTSQRGLENPIITGSVQSLQPIISDKEKRKIQQIVPYEPIVSRLEAFQKIVPQIPLDLEQADKVRKLYQDSFKFFLDTIVSDLIESDLLKEVRSGSSEKLFSDSKSEQNLKKIQLVDFTREASEKEKTKGIDPHLFDFLSLEKDFAELHEQNKQKKKNAPSVRQLRGLEKRESPFGDAAGVILAKAIIRTVVIEYYLKTIFILDRFNYSSYLSELEVVNQLVASSVLSEISKREQSKQIFKNIDKLYDFEKSRGNVEAISTEEKTIPNIRLKKLIKGEFENLGCKVSKILGKEQSSGLEDFLKPILENIEVINKHRTDKSIQNRYFDLFQRNPGKYQVFVFEKSIRLGEINQEYLTENVESPELRWYYGDTYNKDYSLQQFREILQRTSNKNLIVYNCDDTSQGIYKTPPKITLTLNFVTSTGGFGGFPTKLQKEGYVKNGKTIQRKYFRFPVVSESRENTGQSFTVSGLSAMVDENSLFFGNTIQYLKKKIIQSDTAEVLFTYCYPLKEIISMLLVHCINVHSDEKFALLFESTKMLIDDFVDRMSNIGIKTSSAARLKKMKQKQKEGEDNLGNPLGPINPEALKMFIRTPIQIMKGLATTVDPNVAIADKIVGASSMAAALAGQKFALPYSVASLALLPFPIFTGPPPVGIAPPLTAYNIAFPVGPMFLALEPLLWDLPWWQNQNKEDESNKKSTELPEEIEEKCQTGEENNN